MELAAKLSKILPMDEYKRRKLTATLRSAEIPMTAELYIAQAMIKAGLVLLCIIPCLLIAPIISPVFTAKQQRDIFATEVVRQAEIVGGTHVNDRINDLQKQTGRNPQIRWDCDYYSGSKVQLNGDIEVTLTDTVEAILPP